MRQPKFKDFFHKYWPVMVIVLMLLVAYSNTFNSPFIFDDVIIIGEIRKFWPDDWIHYLFYGNRFLFNLAILINYAISGDSVLSYHIFSFLMHMGATIVLYLLMLKILTLKPITGQVLKQKLVALVIALIWGLHPIQTESVTYISQSAEVMMGLFSFLTLYFLSIGAETKNKKKNLWYGLSIVCCLAGAASKEAMVGTIAIIPFFDRAFLSNSIKDLVKSRKFYYATLALLLVTPVIILGPNIISNAFFSLKDIGPIEYFYTQCEVVIYYILLSFFPLRLCFDYSAPYVVLFSNALPYFIPLCLLFISSIYLFFKKPVFGFWALFFFVTLAPRSSFAPRPDAVVEHRMYLPILGIIVLTVLFCCWIYLLVIQKLSEKANLVRIIFSTFTVTLIISLMVLSFMRNRVYQNEFDLWYDTVQKRPKNPRAHNYLGIEYNKKSDFQKAEKHFREAIKINPEYDLAHNNLGNMLAIRKDLDNAIKHYELSLRYRVKRKGDEIRLRTYKNLARVYFKKNNFLKAKENFLIVVRDKPNDFEANFYLGIISLISGKKQDALNFFKISSDNNSSNVNVDFKIAKILEQTGMTSLAVNYYYRAQKIEPRNLEAKYKYGSLLIQMNKFEQAKKVLNDLLFKHPKHALALNDVGVIFSKQKQYKQAEPYFSKAINIKPDYAAAYFNLGICLGKQKKYNEAVKVLSQAHKISPTNKLIDKYLQSYQIILQQ